MGVNGDGPFWQHGNINSCQKEPSPLTTLVLRGMGALSPEERPVIGSLVNEVRDELEKLISEKESEFKQIELNKKLSAETIDITLPGKKVKKGSKNPMNIVIEEIEDLFVSMGYDVI